MFVNIEAMIKFVEAGEGALDSHMRLELEEFIIFFHDFLPIKFIHTLADDEAGRGEGEGKGDKAGGGEGEGKGDKAGGGEDEGKGEGEDSPEKGQFGATATIDPEPARLDVKP